MSIPHEFDTINTSKYLFLRGLSEPWDNALTIISQEAVVNTFAEPRINTSLLPEIAALLKNANSIESNDLCRAFELHWESYVAYLVTNESFSRFEDATFAGSKLRTYTKSRFLEHLARDTDGHQTTLLHYKLLCENHIIDVAAYDPPAIRLIRLQREQ